MPLTWDRAFGGIDKSAPLVAGNPPIKPWCERNYLGKGFCAARTVASIHNTPLPNIEDPDDLIRTWDSRPRPVGCGFFPRNSRPRADWFGTYDEKWKAERAPELPVDFRFDAYNGADLSMQAGPYLVGNERVRLVNVTLGGGVLVCSLPGAQPRLATTQRETPRELVANLDTVTLIPGRWLCCVVWRATLAIDSDDASDVGEIRIDYDSLPESLPEPVFARRANA